MARHHSNCVVYGVNVVFVLALLAVLGGLTSLVFALGWYYLGPTMDNPQAWTRTTCTIEQSRLGTTSNPYSSGMRYRAEFGVGYALSNNLTFFGAVGECAVPEGGMCLLFSRARASHGASGRLLGVTGAGAGRLAALPAGQPHRLFLPLGGAQPVRAPRVVEHLSLLLVGLFERRRGAVARSLLVLAGCRHRAHGPGLRCHDGRLGILHSHAVFQEALSLPAQGQIRTHQPLTNAGCNKTWPFGRVSLARMHHRPPPPPTPSRTLGLWTR